MPQRTDHPPWRLEYLPLDVRLATDAGHPQEGWYRFLAERVCGKTVLDVGAGTGYGLAILREAAVAVEGIDPSPAGDGVLARDIAEYGACSWDVVVAVDVIEHVGWIDGDAYTFLGHLLRVARERVFFSTPNYQWPSARMANPYHAREFTPAELRALLTAQRVELWASGLDRVPRPLAELRDDDETTPNFGVFVEVP